MSCASAAPRNLRVRSVGQWEYWVLDKFVGAGGPDQQDESGATMHPYMQPGGDRTMWATPCRVVCHLSVLLLYRPAFFTTTLSALNTMEGLMGADGCLRGDDDACNQGFLAGGECHILMLHGQA